MISVRIKNIKQIRRAFKKAPDDLTFELSKAVKKSGVKVEYEAKAHSVRKGLVRVPIPKATPVDTGTMRRSIRAKPTLMESLIQAHTDYADYVHGGTRYMRGRPFMEWAVERSINKIDDYFEKALDNVLKKIRFRAL